MGQVVVLFEVFGLPVTAWALCVTLSSLAATALICVLWKKRGLDGDALTLFLPVNTILGIFLGHALFALVASLLDPYVLENLGMSRIAYIFAPFKGGFMGLGVLCGLFLSALITRKVTGVSFQEILKVALPAALLVIGVAKWGEWLCGQGTGPEASTSFFPVSFTPEPDYPEWRVIAVFWLGGLYALCLAAWGIGGALRKNGVRPVTLLVVYLAGQVFFDMLREDEYVHYLAMNFVRMDQLFSVLIMAGLMVWASVRIKQAGKKGIVRWWVVMLVSVGLCIGLQFLFDKPLPFFGQLIYPPTWLVYALIGVTAVGMGLSTLMLLEKARKVKAA